MKRVLLTTLIILILSNASFSQGPIWKVWNTSNSNIPSNSLQSIFIDDQNIKWIGSNQGLIKFNDVSFTNFNISNSPMKGNWVFCIKPDKLQNLWITAFKQGGEGALMKFDKINNWSFYNSQNSSIESGNQTCFTIDTNNVVWSKFHKLNRFNGSKWFTYNPSPFWQNISWAAFTDSKNNIWVGEEASGLFRLKNDTSWSFYNTSNSGFVGGDVHDINEDSFGNIWVGTTYGGLCKYNPDSNTWKSWRPQNSNLYSPYITRVHIDKNNNKWIGCKTAYKGLIFFNDTIFTNYLLPGSEFFTPDIYDIKEDIFGNLWLATTEGLMEFNKNGIVGISENNSVVNNFELQQNYPNPFNPTTTINYELKITNYVTLNVYDINGRLVKELINQKQSAGNYSIDFDGSGLPSGTYVYRLQAGDFSETKKMVLLK